MPNPKIENLEKAKNEKKSAEVSQLEIEIGGLRATHEINLRTKDSKIDLSISQHLKEQQEQLAREEIPGFEVTDDSRKIRLQYHLVNSLISMPKWRIIYTKNHAPWEWESDFIAVYPWLLLYFIHWLQNGNRSTLSLDRWPIRNSSRIGQSGLFSVRNLLWNWPPNCI